VACFDKNYEKDCYANRLNFSSVAEFFVFLKSLADQKKQMLKVALISQQCILKHKVQEKSKSHIKNYFRCFRNANVFLLMWRLWTQQTVGKR
jgi:translation initiation factor 2 beta subunit (eIF-2beta)/eIF-5